MAGIQEEHSKEHQFQALSGRVVRVNERWANGGRRGDQQIAEQNDGDQANIAEQKVRKVKTLRTFRSQELANLVAV